MHHRNVLDLFAKPKVDLTNNLNYYCLDGGSLLPVLALDLAPGKILLLWLNDLISLFACLS